MIMVGGTVSLECQGKTRPNPLTHSASPVYNAWRHQVNTEGSSHPRKKTTGIGRLSINDEISPPNALRYGSTSKGEGEKMTPIRRDFWCLIFIVCLLLFLPISGKGTTNQWSVYFSPNGGCTEAIVKEIAAAKKSILVQAYSFSSAPIAKALVEAHKRGVKVEAIPDKSNKTDKYSAADFLLHADIPTRIDAAHAIAHNKVMIIDGETVITGSFNFTKAAEEKNAENLLIIKDKDLAAKYAENWKNDAGHSEVYTGMRGR
jgi:phosphatidylserine/phosphatidylglycerophosphate/cardiolipin synthase-like enzyme